ncbi:MAG TPA: P-II family nitrogen regulator [Acholeplasmataceae bacterium]|nr:P-II family nitrogen regulator [Acholeplasmataceae bacterium]
MSGYRVIFAISNHGYSQEVMETAKKAGARGGTVLRGRSSAIHEETKFFGITIHPEKDILMIVAPLEDTEKIMSAISNNHGVGTEAHTLCFSLEIDNLIGFNFDR